MDEHIILLKQLYGKLKDVCLRKDPNKFKKSVLFGLLNLSSRNKRRPLLIDASVSILKVNYALAEKLLSLNFLRYIDEEKHITLTLRGIWEIENKSQLIDNDALLNFIEDKFFDSYTSKPLKDNEKVILFTLLAARAFSEDSSVDLRKDQAVHTAWQDMVSLAFDFLYENNIIDDSQIKTTLFKGKKDQASLNPVKHCFRYSENLPKKSHEAFVVKPLRYFLNIYKNNQTSSSDLTFLFKLVFQNKLNHILISKVNNFCTDASYNMRVKVFNTSVHNFANPDIDDLVENALHELLIA
jgi:hypothetical protein